ncbi:aminomethyl-transferring glycine dehydrogenase [Litorivicinus sp.]|nr:aminomethyl-transferring glycine dehydrogenase [Litorivicinus sp.]
MNQEKTFRDRHIGLSDDDRALMLQTLGLQSMDELATQVVPENIRKRTRMSLPHAVSEVDALAELKAVASKNQVVRTLIGQGYYHTLTPAVIQRNVLENPAWYTAYTPYQPEISQGRLEALFNYQTMVVELTGMAVANASLLDEGTAAAEAMTLCARSSKSKSKRFYVASNLFTQTRAVIETRAKPLGFELIEFDAHNSPNFDNAFGLIVQYTGHDGSVIDLAPIIQKAKDKGILTIVTADILSLTLLEGPGHLGADICLGSTQRFGVPMGNGGPHAAFFAVADKLKRNIPGRLVGQSIDSEGRDAFRLTLQTREQHIRREKATSNICTAQVLLANIAGFYACYHGPSGLTAQAERVHHLASRFHHGIKAQGNMVNQTFFDTVSVRVSDADAVVSQALKSGFNIHKANETTVSVSFDEASNDAELETLASVFGIELGEGGVTLPKQLQRQTAFMTQEAFNTHHSETEMMRYLRKLSDRDLALDRAMIPLGSCTMKLNAASEMAPITWPEFANIHPFAPAKQRLGYQEVIQNLNAWLAEITDYAGISLQPNSGAQGEYAGLLAIQGYHHSRGDTDRTICLVPSSAHGTNPASAQMVGLDVVVIGCDRDGNIDLDDLNAKLEQYGTKVSCLMITYPSTHGVFESHVQDVCRCVHSVGGQIYLDGANLNAQVGLTSPGLVGSDVSHLNLHKTFCIPHGGGGPGVGPIGVAEHLMPFMPGHPELLSESPVGPVSAAPVGSAMILPISWMYIRMMGPDGLTDATENAILSANYIAKRLAPHYPILYTDAQGLIAHECILDTRVVKESAGVTVDDIAKRLIDYGFHAPTMSWPVAGTLMIEPTESEPLCELDRFCDAMIAIRHEITAIESDNVSADNSILRHAPYTVEAVTADQWPHAFSRQQAAFPLSSLKTDRYWPSVARIDNVYGDRNLVCSCPPFLEYTDKPTEAA